MTVQKSEILGVEDFLKTHTAYDLLPESGKVIVLDVGLAIASAFQAFAENSVRSAPLWDNRRQEYVGMITSSDLLEIVLELHTHLSQEEFEESLEIITIREWNRWKRQKQTQSKTQLDKSDAAAEKPARIPLIFVHPEASLYDASRVLLNNHLHRGPVIDMDTQAVLHIITHARILRLIVSNWRHDTHVLDRTIAELGIGTYGKVEFNPQQEKKKEESKDKDGTQTIQLSYILEGTSVIAAMRVMQDKKISALPVLGANGGVVGIYASSDLSYLPLAHLHGALQLPVSYALKHRSGLNVPRLVNGKPLVFKCKKTDKLRVVLRNLAENNIHRLVIVGDDNKLEGVISVNDILRFFTSLSPDGTSTNPTPSDSASPSPSSAPTAPTAAK
ncbi:MAG: putative 5'-AMP-activated protein kinase subunit gamma-2 [Streblomastix strix]|uniref:Putative 5'-AMP-activated protein kinase subunit gamma-2 n=1 Tax=Streblomastix strix TaxID=222440 RepID=A0A5J4X6T0_9EUKA|nr:MAG: putative 5'-AMP-activated protein kinase subunit gamma-2 [Streblomastix strix]